PKSNLYSFLHPSISEDGSRLYFASDMPGGYGGVDLYYVDFDKEKQVYGKPVNLGPKINTNGDELFPYIEGTNLHFSSNGHKGYGGQDIFVINLKETDATVFHFPYPINTHFDDSNPVYDVVNKKYYFSSDRKNSEDDNLSNKCVYVVQSPDPMLSIMEAVNKTVTVGPIGNIAVASTAVEELVALPKEEIFRMVHFDFDKAILKTEELYILDDIYQLWALNKKAMIELSGNTDTLGKELYNLGLSKKRAEVVQNYLISKGIPKESFLLRFNGDTNPLKRIEPGMTEEEIEQVSRENRRTVITIK
ncbi:OmpA family protein, partial [Flavobacterium sp. ALJ2]|uniref:OmpA family protein n=1 Tax=Flavobacterium sp. ALJ2 TaxID=2786960 RepID=UPI00189E270E